MRESTEKIGLILLAAGASGRYGKFPKQLLIFRGKTLLRRAAENALAADCEKVCVVLGARAEELKSEIAGLPVEIVVNDDWQSGMNSSLKKGLEKLLEIEPELSAVAITLCDQPLVDAAIIERLIENFRQSDKPIAAARYAETVGVPAIFARSMFAEIFGLSENSGAKRLIKKYEDSVLKIPLPEAALDIDTAGDYESLLKL